MLEQADPLYERIEEIRRAQNERAPSYRRAGYFFALDLVDYTIDLRQQNQKCPEESPLESVDLAESVMPQRTEDDHVSAATLLSYAVEYARREFGPMAERVLEYWNIHRPEDLGNVVFRLIGGKLLQKGDEDSLEDFQVGRSMGELLAQRPYVVKLKD